MSSAKVKRKKHSAELNRLRQRAAQKNIFTLTELARRVPCSVTSIYFAVERPSRFGRVTKRLEEILNG
jgi:hypothetical protein